jgi:hypothetical protein
MIGGGASFRFGRPRRRKEAKPEEWSKLRRGWCYGDEQFRKELLASVHQRQGPSHYAQQKREAAEARAKHLVEEELKGLGWKRAELVRRPKGDKEKIRIARRLRAETTVSLKWVAACLVMGAWTNVANHLCHLR